MVEAARKHDENAAIRRELARLTDQVEALHGLITDALRAREPDVAMLSAKEAAAVLRVCTKTLSTMVRREGLPAHRVGGQYRYRRSELLAWLETRAQRPGAHVARHTAKIREA